MKIQLELKPDCVIVTKDFIKQILKCKYKLPEIKLKKDKVIIINKK